MIAVGNTSVVIAVLTSLSGNAIKRTMSELKTESAIPVIIVQHPTLQRGREVDQVIVALRASAATVVATVVATANIGDIPLLSPVAA